jgi:hypothetical protein
MSIIVHHTQEHPYLELTIWPIFCPVVLNFSILFLLFWNFFDEERKLDKTNTGADPSTIEQHILDYPNAGKQLS